MALTTAEETFFTAQKTNVLADITAITSGLSTDQLRDLTSCAIALGVVNREPTDTLGYGYSKSVTNPTGLVDSIYNFVSGSSGAYVFPEGHTKLIPRNSLLTYRKALDAINLYDYGNQQWATNLNAPEIKAELQRLLNRFGHLTTNGWQKIFNYQFNLGVQDEASLSVANPIIPASGRWGIVDAATLDYQELNSYESTDESAITGGTNTLARSTEQAYSGIYSLKSTFGNSKLQVRQPTATLATSTSYTVTAWVFLPSDWDGGNITLNSLNFSDITEDSNIAASGSILEQWQKVTLEVTTLTDVAGDWEVRCVGTPTVGRSMYTDFIRVTDSTLVWDATAQTNNVRAECITYMGHALRDYQFLSNTTMSRLGGNTQGLDLVGTALRNLQGYDNSNVNPDMQFVDSSIYLSSEAITANNRSFRENTAVKAKEGKDYITW